MGIRIQRNTWRAPLQLIDSWLPQPPAPSSRHHLSAITQRFARAGWLGRVSAQPEPPARSTTGHEAPAPAAPSRAHRVASVRVVPAINRVHEGVRADTRVVLSGRIADVCAELERLAALEPGLSAVQH